MKAGIPPGMDLGEGYVLQFTALNPTTGAVDTGVVISSASLLVDNLGGGDPSGGFADIAPLWVPIPGNLFAPEPAG
jgi:hypothetical protein